MVNTFAQRQERDHAGDAPPERVLLDLAEAKDQERLHRQDHKHDKPDQEIGAPYGRI